MLAKFLILAGTLQAALAMHIPRQSSNGADVDARSPLTQYLDKLDVSGPVVEVRATRVEHSDDHDIHARHDNDTDHETHHDLVARNPGGKIHLENRCGYDVWVWSVNEGVSHCPSPDPSLQQMY